MKIIVDVRNVYGNEMIYPFCETALILIKLTGKRTFSRDDITNIKALGYSVEVKTKEL